MVVLLDRAELLALLPQYLLLIWKSRGGADIGKDTHGLTEARAWEIITKLRQGIGPDLESLIARAWELVGKCFDQRSSECVDFHGLSQNIARFTRERIAEREA